MNGNVGFNLRPTSRSTVLPPKVACKVKNLKSITPAAQMVPQVATSVMAASGRIGRSRGRHEAPWLSPAVQALSGPETLRT